MSHQLRAYIPPSLCKYVVLEMLKQLKPGMRLELNDQTHVIRCIDHYVAYRNWMSILPLVEVFYSKEEYKLISWLEQFGYPFEQPEKG